MKAALTSKKATNRTLIASMLLNLPVLVIAAEIVREAAVAVQAGVEVGEDVVVVGVTVAVAVTVVAGMADMGVAAEAVTKRTSRKLQRPRENSRPFSFQLRTRSSINHCHSELLRGTRTREGPYEVMD